MGRQRQTTKQISYVLLKYILKIVKEFEDTKGVIRIRISKNRQHRRYQRGNQNQNIEEQTTQWPKEKVQKDKQRSTKYTYKTKDRVTRTSLVDNITNNTTTTSLPSTKVKEANDVDTR